MTMLSSEVIIDILVVSTVAVSTAFIATAAMLKKMGILHFGKKAGENKRPYEPCLLHGDLITLVNKIKETQLINLQRHVQHENSFAVGEKKFDSLQKDVGMLKEGVGILMDRSGGRPDHWQKLWER